ncbi:hypothetical protein ACFSJM_01685 [Lactococcus formosensis subsp. bovis]|uniref:hypothetical protein n=1 Tax=Lactococcus formosensis TaxID=1281486 RepID=UPI001BCAD3AC|nr:hypothetical protein [Lactococcus formosensis]
MVKVSDEERFQQYRIFSNMNILIANIDSLSNLSQTKENIKKTMIVGNWELIERVYYAKRNGICEFCGKRNLKWAFYIKNLENQLSYMIGGNCLEKKTKTLTHKVAVNKIENWEAISKRIAESKNNFDEQIEEFIEWGLPKINVKTASFGIELEIKDIIDDLLEETSRKVALGRLKTIAHNIGVK